MQTKHLLRAFMIAVIVLSLFHRTAAQCNYIPSTVTSNDTVIFFTSGGSFASFGCAPIDPTFWLSGSGTSITATFLMTEYYPSIRVWGMNSDDSASVKVNGGDYTMNVSSASIVPKVICGISPGPDGSVFANGLIVGANSPADGNYSYNDIIINSAGVNSIKVEGVSGAGWGFAGISVDCVVAVDEPESAAVILFTDPATDNIFITGKTFHHAGVTISNSMGVPVKKVIATGNIIDISDLLSGIYLVVISEGEYTIIRKIMKI